MAADETPTEDVNRDLCASITRGEDITDVIATVQADGHVGFEVKAGGIHRQVSREDAVAIAAIMGARLADDVARLADRIDDRLLDLMTRDR